VYKTNKPRAPPLTKFDAPIHCFVVQYPAVNADNRASFVQVFDADKETKGKTKVQDYLDRYVTHIQLESTKGIFILFLDLFMYLFLRR